MSLPVLIRIPSGSSNNSFNFCDLFESFCDSTEELKAADLTHDMRVFARR